MALNGTPQQEAFSYEYVRNGEVGTDAYRTCYNTKANDSVIRVNSARLLKLKFVQNKIKEIKANLRIRHEFGIEKIVSMLKKSYDVALESDPPQCGASVQAASAIAKIMGLEIDRREVHHTGSIGVNFNFSAVSVAKAIEEHDTIASDGYSEISSEDSESFDGNGSNCI